MPGHGASPADDLRQDQHKEGQRNEQMPPHTINKTLLASDPNQARDQLEELSGALAAQDKAAGQQLRAVAVELVRRGLQVALVNYLDGWTELEARACRRPRTWDRSPWTGTWPGQPASWPGTAGPTSPLWTAPGRSRKPWRRSLAAWPAARHWPGHHPCRPRPIRPRPAAPGRILGQAGRGRCRVQARRGSMSWGEMPLPSDGHETAFLLSQLVAEDRQAASTVVEVAASSH